MDGENHGKTLLKFMIWGGLPYFWKHPNSGMSLPNLNFPRPAAKGQLANAALICYQSVLAAHDFLSCGSPKACPESSQACAAMWMNGGVGCPYIYICVWRKIYIYI